MCSVMSVGVLGAERVVVCDVVKGRLMLEKRKLEEGCLTESFKLSVTVSHAKNKRSEGEEGAKGK